MPAYPGFGMPGSLPPMYGENMDIMGQDPQDDGGGISLMAEMLGIQMPQMPSRDPYGNYGITQQQGQSAGNQGLARALMGASQSFMGGGAAPALQGGMMAGNVRRQALQEFSQRNALDYELQVKDALAKLSMIDKKSNIELSMMKADQARIELESSKRQQEIAKAAIAELAPVADDTIAEAMKISTSYGQEMRVKFLAIQQKMEAGKLEEADTMMGGILNELAAMDPTGGAAARFDAKTKTAIMMGLAKNRVDTSVIQEIMKMPEFQGYSYEIGPNGQPSVVSPYEAAKRQAALDLTRSQARENYAQTAKARKISEAAGYLTPAGATKAVNDATMAIGMINSKPPALAKDRAKWEEEIEKAKASLINVGVNPESAEEVAAWSGKSLAERVNAVMRGAQQSLGGMVGQEVQSQREPANPAHVAALLRNATASPLTEEDANRVLSDLALQNEPKIQQLLQSVHGATAMEKLQKIYSMYPGAKR